MTTHPPRVPYWASLAVASVLFVILGANLTTCFMGGYFSPFSILILPAALANMAQGVDSIRRDAAHKSSTSTTENQK